MALLTPRPYQRAAVDAVFEYFRAHAEGHPIVDAPTASGKSVILAHLCAITLAEWPGQRLLMLTHRAELIRQNEQRLRSAWPQAPVGVYSAGLSRRELDAPILFAGIQSLARARALPWFDLVLIDECHWLPAFDKPSQYRRVIDRLLDANPRLRVVGLSATPYRLDTGWLHVWPDHLFTDVCYRITIETLLDAGVVAPLRPFGSDIAVDMSGVRVQRGEYVERDMAAVFAPVTQDIVAEICERGADRHKWLLFGATVEHCTQIQVALAERGIAADVVTGRTARPERERILARYAAGELRALINCNVLTTGFDAPDIDLIAILRATQSASLYVQILGRGMRVADHKSDCLVLDYGHNVERHGPINRIDPKAPGDKTDGTPPCRQCPNCDAVMPIAVVACEECGYAFPPPESGPKLANTANCQEIIDRSPRERWLAVDAVEYVEHTSRAGNVCLRVTYCCGALTVHEYVGVESRGYARAKAQAWWRECVIDERAIQVIDYLTAATAASICTKHARRPAAVRVQKNGRYLNVIDYDWTGDKRPAEAA